MVSFDEIKNHIAKELDSFNREFDKALDSDNAILKLVNQHIINSKGKQIRPTMVILSSKICDNVNENTNNVALALELLHTASLLHDDVVDESDKRRGQKSVNAIWDNKIAILVGDYLLSQALNIATKTDNLEVIKTITSLGKKLTDGELKQIKNVQDVNTLEERYLDVIRMKTAQLFAACTSCGAIVAKASKEDVDKLLEFGEKYGMLFQIRDDVFDYISSENKIGKPVGNDIREGKITLPLIYALSKADEQEKNKIQNIFRQKDFTKENIDAIISFAIDKGGIEYAQKRMEEYKEEAESLLSGFKDGPAKEGFKTLLKYSLQRKN